MIHDQRIRSEVTRASHYWFFLTYLAEYVKHPFADFHREMFAITEDDNLKMAVVMAFRGSGKSTVFTLSYPIWAVLGSPKKKFVLLVAQTQAQAKLYLTNLKRELEANELLRGDLGPFDERQEEWSAGTLVIPKFGARITAISTEQSVRGIRHGSHRPDLIICDDLEDLASVKTHESRQKMWHWLMGDVIPSGDQKTKVIVVGNMLHESSLLMRLKEEIKAGTRDGLCRTYPLLNEDGSPTWPGKFPTPGDITEIRRRVDDAAWSREYLMKIVSDTERVIHPEWLHFYDNLPDCNNGLFVHSLVIGVDVAISESEMADYTAFVPILVFSDLNACWQGYVLPRIVNKRMSFPETVDLLKIYARSFEQKKYSTVYIEDAGYQRALAQQLEREHVKAEAVGLKGLGKRERIALVSAAIKTGQFMFPKIGAEDLIRQMVEFGQDKHDDIVDAFTLAARKIIEDPPRSCRVYWF